MSGGMILGSGFGGLSGALKQSPATVNRKQRVFSQNGPLRMDGSRPAKKTWNTLKTHYRLIINNSLSAFISMANGFI